MKTPDYVEVMPGAWWCPTCGFSLNRCVMRASDGVVGVNAGQANEPCPNGCVGLLEPVTYKQAFADMVKVSEDQVQRACRAEAALAEVREERDRHGLLLQKQQRQQCSELGCSESAPPYCPRHRGDWNQTKLDAYEQGRREAEALNLQLVEALRAAKPHVEASYATDESGTCQGALARIESALKAAGGAE